MRSRALQLVVPLRSSLCSFHPCTSYIADVRDTDCSGHGRASPSTSETIRWRPFGSTSSLPLFGASRRSFATSSPPVGTLLQDTLTLLDHANVLRLREELNDESETHLHVPLSRVFNLIKQHGLAKDTAQAQRFAEALHVSGIILIHHGVVYLRPREIAEMVMQLLPGSKEEARKRLADIEAELKDLEDKRKEAEKAALWQTSLIMSCGVAWLVLHIIVFVWLIYWELTWDVMEPIAYIVGLCYTLFAYMWFIATRNVFDIKPLHDHFHKRLQKNKLEAWQFDESRYAHLQRLKARHMEHLQHQAISLPGVAKAYNPVQ